MSDTPKRNVEVADKPRNHGVDPAVRAMRLENRNVAAPLEARRALDRRQAETNPKVNEIFTNLLALQSRISPEEFAKFLNRNERDLVRVLAPFYQGCAATPEGTLKQFGAAVNEWSKIRHEADSGAGAEPRRPPSDAFNRLEMWKTAAEYPLAAPSIVIGHVISEGLGDKLGIEQDPVKAASSGKAINDIAKAAQALNIAIGAVSAKDSGKRVGPDQLKIPEAKPFGATDTNPDPKLLRLARDVRVTQAGVTRQAFETYNVATARVRVDGQVRYLDSGNSPGGLHSEQWLHTQIHALGTKHHVVVEQLYTERIPCKDNCRPILEDKKYRDTQVFFTTSANGAHRARELMKAYGLDPK